MKNLLLILITVLVFPVTSWGLTYEFLGSTNFGTGSGIMDFTVSGTTIDIAIRNTSPITLDGIEGANAPAITGFGFLLDNSTLPEIALWSLNAFNTDGENVPVAGSSLGDSGDWNVAADSKFSGIHLDYLGSTDNGVQGGLYNPLATEGLAALPNYFTEATFSISFLESPLLATTPADLGSGLYGTAMMRMQNVGAGGEGSLKLTPVPEPSTLLLVGLGLIVAAIYGRKRHG